MKKSVFSAFFKKDKILIVYSVTSLSTTKVSANISGGVAQFCFLMLDYFQNFLG